MGKMKAIFQKMKEEGYKGNADEYLEKHVKDMIFERNHDTGEIRVRNAGDYGNEVIHTEGVQAGPVDLRKEIADDIWAADKKLVDGKWYISISDVIKIIQGEI